MAAEDFEAQYARLGLQNLPAHATVDSTFASGEHDVTVLSPPREGADADFEGTLGTLPRLSLAMPDAVQGADAKAELVAERVLGEGGMGRVLLARQQSLNRDVAVKVLKPSIANAAAAAALVEEARTTGSLEHPGVVPVYALARDSNGLPALVMKRVDGVSWRTLIHDDRHPANTRIARGEDRLEAHLEVLIQICNAVAHAHRRGVIHRDLKPANILIGELGEVYVADWGVAIQKDGRVAGPPRLVGTPAYLAPEMVTGDPTLMDERTDVYLLGGTLHEVLTRSPTHVGASIHDVLQRAWAAAPPHLPEVAPELAAICARALAADPRARFQNAIELRDALRLFLRHRGSTRLADAARERLAKMEAMPATEDRGWYVLVSECRFGFAQALLADPKSGDAAAGLERCLEVAARREIERGATETARAFLTELKDPPAALKGAFEALVAKDAVHAKQAEMLRAQARELDPNVSVRQRNRVVVSVMVSMVFGAVMAGWDNPLRRWTIDTFGRWHRMVPMTVITLTFFAALYAGRRAVLVTRINRQLMAVVGIGAVAVWLGRVMFAFADVPVRVAVVHDAIVIAAMTFMCAFLLHRSFAVPASVFLLGGVLSLFVPEPWVIGAFSVAALLGLVVTIALFGTWQKDLEKLR